MSNEPCGVWQLSLIDTSRSKCAYHECRLPAEPAHDVHDCADCGTTWEFCDHLTADNPRAKCGA